MSTIPSTTNDSVLRVVRNQTLYIEWEIHKFFDKTYVSGQYIQSPTFSFSGAEWIIWFYPNYGNNVHMGLMIIKSLKDVRVSMAIGIKSGKDSAFKSFYRNRLFEKNVCRWEVPKFPTSELLQCKDVVAPNGVLTIFLMACNMDGYSEEAAVAEEVAVAVEAACQTPSDGLETLSQNLKDLFLDKDQGDISFKVQGKEFLAHKAVLSARSTVFRAMLKTDMVEKNDGVVNILDADADNFKAFLLHVYSGKMDMISPGNALGLFMLADKYNLMELRNACCESLTRDISVDSFCDIAIYASLCNETKLMERIKDFFVENASSILSTPKWISFLLEHVTLANELMIQMANKYKEVS